VIAAVAAGVNWRQSSVERTAAEEEARVALAREFAAHSSSVEDPRAALALAVEAYTLAPDAEHRGSLLAAISGTGSELVELPALLPDEHQAADITSSSVSTDAGGGRVTLSAATGSVAVDLDTGDEWTLPGQAHYLTPDGAHAIGVDGTIFALGGGGAADPIATVPALGTEPSFTTDGDLFAYRHDGSGGAQLVVADIAGEDVRSLPVSIGSDCAGCSGDASSFVIAPDGSMVAARIGPTWAETPIRARLTSYGFNDNNLTELASTELAGVGVVRFTDDSTALWARDDGAVLVLAPDTLEPAGEAMSISRTGPLHYASDALALAPTDNCTLPGVVLPPTMATVAELPADLEYSEGGCYDAATGGEPRWLLGGTWVRTSAGLWPTVADQLLEIACDALGGPISHEEFSELAAVDHTPTGCARKSEES
jgi:hypothetical protein